MDITLSDYLKNPMGKGSAVTFNRNLIIANLTQRYERLIKNPKFKMEVYRETGKDVYYFHFTIPSETNFNTYDVVYLFEDKDNKFEGDMTLKRFPIKVFSNCPSFTYTYAYVYNDNKILIPSLRKKYNGIVLTDTPSVRNPDQTISFEKSTYYAGLYLSNHPTYMNKIFLRGMAKPYNEVLFNANIRTTDKIMSEIRTEQENRKEEKKEKKRAIVRRFNKDVGVHAPKEKKSGGVNKITAKAKLTPKKKITSKKKIR